MKKQFSETNEPVPLHTVSNSAAYSAHIQEAMRYNRLNSISYSLTITILKAVKQGYTETQWQEEQGRLLKALALQAPDKGAPHADAINRYEQVVSCLKDLKLWPW